MYDMNLFFTKNFFKEYFSRNKYLILLSATIFIVSVFIGIMFSKTIEPYAIEMIKNMLENLPSDSMEISAIDLFVNNFSVCILMIILGLIFSIISVFIMVINGALIGYVYTITNPLLFIVGLVPHGIFELTAFVLSLTGAFLLTKIEYNIFKSVLKRNLKNKKNYIKNLLNDLMVTIVISTVLLAIAAVIESTITPFLLNVFI